MALNDETEKAIAAFLLRSHAQEARRDVNGVEELLGITDETVTDRVIQLIKTATLTITWKES